MFRAQSHHYNRDDVALPGIAKYFKENSDEEFEDAHKLMKVCELFNIMV